MVTENEVAKYIVELFADYECLSGKLGYSIKPRYSEAVSLAIMALANTKSNVKEDKE